MLPKSIKRLLISIDKCFCNKVFWVNSEWKRACAGHHPVRSKQALLSKRSWPSTLNPTSWLRTTGSLPANWFDVFPSFDPAVLLLKMNDEELFFSLSFLEDFFLVLYFYLACALGYMRWTGFFGFYCRFFFRYLFTEAYGALAYPKADFLFGLE